jgi:hypothetical protein
MTKKKNKKSVVLRTQKDSTSNLSKTKPKSTKLPIPNNRKMARTKSNTPATVVVKAAPKAAPKISAKSVVNSPAHMSEDEKKINPEIYILNPNTEKYVKRDTPLGKKLAKAEKTGEEVPKTMTDTERLILVVQTLRDSLNLEDDAIKNALKTIEAELPRSFPAFWGGKHKEDRHPEHPKNPCNSYILFTSAVRESTKNANPGMKSKELMALMSDMWKETSKEDRAEYEAEAAVDKKRYEREMVVFETKYPNEARASTKSATSPGKPTKATAYYCFCNEFRDLYKAQNPEMKGTEVTKLLAEKWDIIKKDKTHQEHYQAMADQANEGFEDRVSEYHSSPGSPVKLSKAEQIKANDPENFELNVETGRYVRKEKPKSPKSPKTKAAAKPKAIVKKAVAKVVVEEEDEDLIQE